MQTGDVIKVTKWGYGAGYTRNYLYSLVAGPDSIVHFYLINDKFAFIWKSIEQHIDEFAPYSQALRAPRVAS